MVLLWKGAAASLEALSSSIAVMNSRQETGYRSRQRPLLLAGKPHTQVECRPLLFHIGGNLGFLPVSLGLDDQHPLQVVNRYAAFGMLAVNLADRTRHNVGENALACEPHSFGRLGPETCGQRPRVPSLTPARPQGLSSGPLNSRLVIKGASRFRVCHRGPTVNNSTGERPHPNPLPEGEGTI